MGLCEAASNNKASKRIVLPKPNNSCEKWYEVINQCNYPITGNLIINIDPSYFSFFLCSTFWKFLITKHFTYANFIAINHIDACNGAKCGESCSKKGKNVQGVCDGTGVCVSSIENPCPVKACDGKKCGEACKSGNKAGRCDCCGNCAFQQFIRCGKHFLW